MLSIAAAAARSAAPVSYDERIVANPIREGTVLLIIRTQAQNATCAVADPRDRAQ